MRCAVNPAAMSPAARGILTCGGSRLSPTGCKSWATSALLSIHSRRPTDREVDRPDDVEA